MEKALKQEVQSRWIKPLQYTLSLLIFTTLLMLWEKPATVLATTVTGTQVNYDLNYMNETLVVKPGPGNSTKFYISLDKKKSWENLDASGEVDLSALLSSKEVLIYIKGNKDTDPKEVKLMAEPNSVTAVYKITNGIGQVAYTTSGAAIEYRKGNNGSWKPVPTTLLTYSYEVKGATLYFRSIAIPGIPGLRTGKIISVKIPKRPAQPAVKVDGSKFLITGIKANDTQYFNPTTGLWEYVTLDTKVKTVSLFTLAKISSSANTPLPAMSLEFRTNGGVKKVASSVRLIEIPAQLTCPNTIKLEGSTLTVTDTANRAFEYFKLTSGYTFDISTAKWTTIKANKSVIIPKANVGDRIYVRLKSYVDKNSKLTIPASTYLNTFVVTTLTVK